MLHTKIVDYKKDKILTSNQNLIIVRLPHN